jgi:lipoprotein-anchoring transpeptidase ErfK/SrfK
MKSILSACALLVGLTAAGNADAQILYQIPGSGRAVRPPAPIRSAPAAARTQPRYGGRFVELLVTAGDRWRSSGTVVAALPGAPNAFGGIAVQGAVHPIFQRQLVPYQGPHAPGTIIIDTPRKFLFLVQPGGWAIRYGIGVGRPGFEWAGVKSVTLKREWPDWRPPPEMLQRRPDLPRHLPGGIDNPLGARALYLGSTLYRIHGTNEPWTIGQAVSSGCIRLRNDDVIDLYNRTQVGAKVVVI